MHKKYQQIPSQFIPKYNHKYQLKKTLINTKFQWLMKYINQENQNYQENNLAKAIKVQIKPTVPFHDKQILKQSNNYFHHHCLEENSIHFKHNYNNKTQKSIRPSLSKSNHDEQIFIDKQKFRNKSLLSRNVKRTKKTNLFSQKQNNEGKTTKLNRYKKIKTQGSLQRSKTRIELIRARYQGEPFVLSPWMFNNEQNKQNNEQFKFV